MPTIVPPHPHSYIRHHAYPEHPVNTAFQWLFSPTDGGNDDNCCLRTRLEVFHNMEESRAPLTDPHAATVTRIQAGDRGAFDELYLAFYSALVSFAYHYVHERATAEDIVQDTFLAVWNSRESWTVKATAREYLFGAVRNRALKHLRHQKVTDSAATLADREIASGVAHSASLPDINMVNTELRAALYAALAGMTPERRQILTLRWNEQMSYAEISRILGISVDAAKQQVSRAQRSLRELLEKFRP